MYEGAGFVARDDAMELAEVAEAEVPVPDPFAREAPQVGEFKIFFRHKDIR